MHQKNKEIDTENAKIIKLVSGEEICCTLSQTQLTEKSNLLRLDQPMLIKYVPHIGQMGVSDYIALVKWVGFTDDEMVSIPKDKIMTICNATPAFSARYKKLLKYKVNQKLPDYIERDLHEDEYDDMLSDDELTERTKKKLKEIEERLNMPSKKLH
tara:strand:+ start:1025 stop:1492 length:468 start_codon:yes stop_codon:yes gene_type:complete